MALGAGAGAAGVGVGAGAGVGATAAGLGFGKLMMIGMGAGPVIGPAERAGASSVMVWQATPPASAAMDNQSLDRAPTCTSQEMTLHSGG